MKRDMSVVGIDSAKRVWQEPAQAIPIFGASADQKGRRILLANPQRAEMCLSHMLFLKAKTLGKRTQEKVRLEL